VRKIGRHSRNVAVHGAGACPRQVEVDPADQERLLQAITAEIRRAGRVGLRTDWLPGREPHDRDRVQCGLLPFRHEATDVQDAFGWCLDATRGRPLSVLVCENVPASIVWYQFCAYRLEDGSGVFIEWTPGAPTQRAMYDHPEFLRRIAVGDGARGLWRGTLVCMVPPTWGRSLYLDVVAALTLCDPDGQVAGTATTDGRHLVW